MNNTYTCDNYDRVLIGKIDTVPECCGYQMKKIVENVLEGCIQPQNSEARRTFDDEDACDDGRRG